MGSICKAHRFEIKQGLSANALVLAEWKINEFIPEKYDKEKGCPVCNHNELQEDINCKITDMTEQLKQVARRYMEEVVNPQIFDSLLG